MRYVQAHAAEEQSQQISQLANVIRLLLPELSGADISKATAKFVGEARELKLELVKEHAVYRIYWVDPGSDYDHRTVELKGEETGPVYVCSFPGLLRTVDKDGAKLDITVVKADAILQSAFAIAK